MNAFDLAITKFKAISKELDTIAETVTPYALDLKRAELRLGVGPKGLMPNYKSPYYSKYKNSKSNYKAGGKYDLFESGELSDKLEANEVDGIIYVGNSPRSPEYAEEFRFYTEGISDKGEKQTATRSYLILHNNISDILNV